MAGILKKEEAGLWVTASQLLWGAIKYVRILGPLQNKVRLERVSAACLKSRRQTWVGNLFPGPQLQCSLAVPMCQVLAAVSLAMAQLSSRWSLCLPPTRAQEKPPTYRRSGDMNHRNDKGIGWYLHSAESNRYLGNTWMAVHMWQVSQDKTTWQDNQPPTTDKSNVSQNGIGHGTHEEASEGV